MEANRQCAKTNTLSNFNNTVDMDAKTLTRIREFRFEGQFLVIDEHYFNLDKLLYFTPRRDCIDFFFQVY